MTYIIPNCLFLSEEFTFRFQEVSISRKEKSERRERTEVPKKGDTKEKKTEVE